MEKYYLKGVTPKIEVKVGTYHEIAGFRVYINQEFINDNMDKLEVLESYETLDGFVIYPHVDKYYLYWTKDQEWIDAFTVDGPHLFDEEDRVSAINEYARIYKNKRAAEIAAERRYK